MHLIEIPDIQLKVNMPGELSECNPQEYMDMCELIFKYQFLQMPFDELKVQAVYKLLNLKPVNKDALDFDPLEEQKMFNVNKIAELIEGFFDTNESGQLLIKQNYTHNPISKFTPVLTSFIGPSDSFMNVNWGEYTDALRAFYQFHASGDVEQLYLIAAILYRPEVPHPKEDRADNRIKYLSSEVEPRIAYFKKTMPLGFIYGVFLYFASFKTFISSALIPWGGKTIDLGIIFSNAEENQSEEVPGLGLDSLTFTVAESQVFGNITHTKNAPMWEILIRMYDIRKKDLDLQKQQNDNSKST